VNSDRWTGLGIGLVAGAAIGLAIGILYAPRPGKETREQLREKSSEMIDMARDKASQVVDRARESTAQMTHKLEQRLSPSKSTSPNGND
jgi:gas vesicle protein